MLFADNGTLVTNVCMTYCQHCGKYCTLKVTEQNRSLKRHKAIEYCTYQTGTHKTYFVWVGVPNTFLRQRCMKWLVFSWLAGWLVVGLNLVLGNAGKKLAS